MRVPNLSVVGSFNLRAPSTSKLAQGGTFKRTANCALVLEDNPVGDDSRLYFESFPEDIEETYAVQQYREIGGQRMPQPAFATYQGGNWGAFPLVLQFRAGEDASGQPAVFDPATGDAPDLDNLLIEMARKARWCEALQFPLERSNLEGQRILAKASTRFQGTTLSDVSTELSGKLRRNDPPFVLIVFGSWHTIRGYCTTASLKWEPPFHPETARPFGATVRMSFQPLMIEYPTWQTIRNLEGVAGYTSSTPANPQTVPSIVQAQRLTTAKRASDNTAALANVRAGAFGPGATGSLSGASATRGALN